MTEEQQTQVVAGQIRRTLRKLLRQERVNEYFEFVSRHPDTALPSREVKRLTAGLA